MRSQGAEEAARTMRTIAPPKRRRHLLAREMPGSMTEDSGTTRRAF